MPRVQKGNRCHQDHQKLQDWINTKHPLGAQEKGKGWDNQVGQIWEWRGEPHNWSL